MVLLPVSLAGLQKVGTNYSIMHRELGPELREI